VPSPKAAHHRDLLRPLFFGTAEPAAAERSHGVRQFGPIPFLNGGLFEPHPLERVLHGDIPNALWRDRSTVCSSGFTSWLPRERARRIAPDMLGKVFEGVMAPDARRASGTYYTPAALVRSLLDAALTAYIAGGQAARSPLRSAGSPSASHRRWRCSSSVTLLDPAAGSGRSC